MPELVLPRPASKPTAGPADDRFWGVVETEFRRMVEQHPILATYVGLHEGDDRLDDATRDAVTQEIDDAHRIERDPGGPPPGREGRGRVPDACAASV